jgi:uncharacterized protein (TIGR00369 family)
VIINEPVRGSYPEPGLFALSGLEQMEVWSERQGPATPIMHLTGVRLEEFSFNTASYSMPCSPWFQNAGGIIPAGALLLAADVALSSAVFLAFPPATGLATAELSLSIARPVTPGPGRIVAHASRIHMGRSLGLSDVVLEDAGGRLVAHGTSRQFVFPPLDPAPPRPEAFPPIQEPSYGSPDPYEREPVEGDLLPEDVWERMGGLEILEEVLQGRRLLGPLAHLMGLRLVHAESGRATFTTRASEWFATGLRTVYGGVLGLLADLAMTTAVLSTVPPKTAGATLDLSVNFLRPVFPDDRELEVRGAIVHRGKTLAVTTGEIVNADGKAVVFSKSTTMLLSGRTWSAARPPIPEDELPPEEPR